MRRGQEAWRLNEELSLILSLRKVLEAVVEGSGVSASLVRELRRSARPGPDVARKLLLGIPMGAAVGPLSAKRWPEVAMLAAIIVESAKSSTLKAGKKGEEVSYMLERWTKWRENRRLDERVMRFRGLIACGVLGAVTSMVASLGPIIGSLGLTGGKNAFAPELLLYTAAALVGTSSAMLGIFISGRKFYLNLAAAFAAFVLVGFMVAPLANLPSASLWGIK